MSPSCLDTVEDSSGPIAADYVLSVVRGLCNWYAARHENYSSPIVRGMRRTDPKARARARILDDDEIRVVWKAAEENGVVRRLYPPGAATAQRREKVVATRLEDIDIEGLGTFPRPRARREPLAPQAPRSALAIIKAQPRFASNPYALAAEAATSRGSPSAKHCSIPR